MTEQMLTGKDQIDNILQERARILAKPLDKEDGDGERIEVLSFMLNGEQYAVPMKYVKEVTLLRHLTSLPGTPDFILGIIGIRGRIISVTDLRVFLIFQGKVFRIITKS